MDGYGTGVRDCGAGGVPDVSIGCGPREVVDGVGDEIPAETSASRGRDAGSAFIGGRYNLGLLSMVKGGQMDLQFLGYDITVEIDEGDNVYAEGFQIMMGFTFPLGKNPRNGE